MEDDQNKAENIADADEHDLQKEKERELGILESVLGTPFKMKSQETKTSK